LEYPGGCICGLDDFEKDDGCGLCPKCNSYCKLPCSSCEPRWIETGTVNGVADAYTKALEQKLERMGKLIEKADEFIECADDDPTYGPKYYAYLAAKEAGFEIK